MDLFLHFLVVDMLEDFYTHRNDTLVKSEFSNLLDGLCDNRVLPYSMKFEYSVYCIDVAGPNRSATVVEVIYEG